MREQEVDEVFHHHMEVDDVARYFVQVDALRDEPDVTPMKLQKLLYFAQANYLASTGQRLFDERVEAFEHGPVVHRAWRQYPGKQIIATQSNESFSADSDLPDDVESFLSEVWRRYRDESASALRRLTHQQEPWMRNYSEGAYRCVIPDVDMITYFRDKVPASERVFHSVVVVVPNGFVEQLDAEEDAIAEQLAALFRD